MKLSFAWRTALGIVFAAIFLLQWTTSASDKTTASVTFSKDVAPILYKNCTVCHRPGEIAPMSLLSYKDVRPWAKSIREVVAERKMPPWLADPHYGEFSNDRRLSQKEIDTIVGWVDSGAKEGDAKDLPPAPKFSDVGWKFGKPDAVLSMTMEADVPSDGVVAYRHFAVPTNFTEDKYVQFAEIKRGDPSVVHHVIVSVREPGQGPLPPAGEINLGAAQRSPRRDRRHVPAADGVRPLPGVRVRGAARRRAAPRTRTPGSGRTPSAAGTCRRSRRGDRCAAPRLISPAGGSGP